MPTPFRSLALAAALSILCATAATAQTPAPAPASPPPAAAPASTPDAQSAAPAAAPADATSPQATAPQAVTTPVAPPVATETQSVDNPYGFEALLKGGGVIAQSVLAVLGIMSLLSWYILIVKVWEQSRLLAAARAANKTFWASASVTDSIGTLKASSPFRYIAETGASATEHHEGTLVEQIDLNSWVTMTIQRSVEEVSNRLRGGLWIQATVGSTAPFVGLFGTVVGIYNALTAIGIAGQASIDKVAGPVGEALIMTAIGLFVAVPAVLGYNILVSRNKSCMEKVRNFSSDLHSVLLSGTRVRA
jgi:biopolymer transport protein ExbB